MCKGGGGVFKDKYNLAYQYLIIVKMYKGRQLLSSKRVLVPPVKSLSGLCIVMFLKKPNK